jgi:chromosome partitioning protein
MTQSVKAPSQVAREIADRLQSAITAETLRALMPTGKKVLKKFQPKDVADLLGVTPGLLRSMHMNDVIPEAEDKRRNGRYYSAQEIWDMRDILEKTARTPGSYRPSRKEGEKLQVIQFMNFKGGCAKTTTCAHFASYLALRGYRVLAIDLDSQASLTTMCEEELFIERERPTIYDAMKPENTVKMADVITPTTLPGLHLAPADLDLENFTFEFATRGSQFKARLESAIEQVEDDYDIVLVDSPPRLDFLTMTGMAATTSAIVTFAPSLLDLHSTVKFTRMASEYMEVLETHSADNPISYDHFKFLITRYNPNAQIEKRIADFVRGALGDHVMTSDMLHSAAITDAGMTRQTVLEVDKAGFSPKTLDRAITSVEGVGAELLQMTHQTWGRI